MGRIKRSWNPHTYYHIYNRGNRKEGLFRKPEDYQFFIQLVERSSLKYPVTITSYCLMKTHYHFQLQSKEVLITEFMSFLNRLYAVHFNKTYNLRGPVFENRFSAKPITDQRSMLHLSRYIHFNPIHANITKKPENYPWSSYSYYFHFNSPPPPSFLNMNPVLNYFPGSENQKKQKYVEWCMY
ncbi:transposase [Evansella clarkii]|jgi:REP element-mobilizing transposase RayT|uniref:transposase n=1 Tax=Evansella clarkii TaxID=79879 RepID=UPI000996939F|nr:transposase [Evansella clarkii]